MVHSLLLETPHLVSSIEYSKLAYADPLQAPHDDTTATNIFDRTQSTSALKNPQAAQTEQRVHSNNGKTTFKLCSDFPNVRHSKKLSQA